MRFRVTSLAFALLLPLACGQDDPAVIAGVSGVGGSQMAGSSGQSGGGTAPGGASAGGVSGGSSGAGGEAAAGGAAAGEGGADGGLSGSSGQSAAGSDGGAAGAVGAPGDLWLLTLNLHCLRLDGTSYTTNAERFGAIAALAASRGVGVLAVQEACNRPGESAIQMLEEALEKATGVAWSSAWTFAHVAWEGTPDQADEGVGVLVRGELSSPSPQPFAVQGSLRRVAISATLPPELHGVQVTSVHFEVFEPWAREAQAREIASAAVTRADPAFASILAGDFNDTETSATWAALPKAGFLGASAGLDPTGIDHVFVHRATPLRPASAEKVFLGEDAVSDHPGVLVRFVAASADAVQATRIDFEYQTQDGHFLSIRGDQSPLSWDSGIPLLQGSAGIHRLVSTELSGVFEFKALLDDKTWQTGKNQQGSSGQSLDMKPVF